MAEAETERLRKTLSANIKRYRVKEGISQEKLAERTKLSNQLIRDIEGCRSWVSDKTLIKLAIALNVEAYQLIYPQSENDRFFPVRLAEDVLRELQCTVKDGIDQIFNAAARNVYPVSLPQRTKNPPADRPPSPPEG